MKKIRKNFKKIISKYSPDADAAKKVIIQYLQKPQEWLKRGFNSFYSFSTYTARGVTQFIEGMDKITRNGVGEIEEETSKGIVTINPAYFNKTLPSDVPQVIMVELKNGYYPHMEKVAALVKKPGALAPVEAMVNPGKSALPVIAPPKIPITYTFKYLPKLKTLKPLVVPVGMKPSVSPVTGNNNSVPTTAAFNFTIPPLSARLNQLPQLVANENYTAYLQ